MIYLASPFSHEDPQVQDMRYLAALRAANNLMLAGANVFSPIAYGYQFYKFFKVAGDAETWKGFNHSMLERCDAVYVLLIEGWDKSKGVAMEIEFAKILKKPIVYYPGN